MTIALHHATWMSRVSYRISTWEGMHGESTPLVISHISYSPLVCLHDTDIDDTFLGGVGFHSQIKDVLAVIKLQYCKCCPLVGTKCFSVTLWLSSLHSVDTYM